MTRYTFLPAVWSPDAMLHQKMNEPSQSKEHLQSIKDEHKSPRWIHLTQHPGLLSGQPATPGKTQDGVKAVALFHGCSPARDVQKNTTSLPRCSAINGPHFHEIVYSLIKVGHAMAIKTS